MIGATLPTFHTAHVLLALVSACLLVWVWPTRGGR